MFDPSRAQPLSPAVAHRRIDAALDAVRAGAQGRNRDQTRELLVAELRARGLMLSPPAVEALVDLIAGGPAQRQAQRLAGQAKLAGLAFRSLSAAIRHRPLPGWDVTAVRLVHSTLPFQSIEVILDRAASEHLAVGDANTFDVWFGPAAPSSPDKHTQPEVKDAADQPVAVFRGEYRVGVLGPDASAAWRPLLHKGREESRTVATFATRRQDGNGEWRLFVGLPYDRSKQAGNEDGVG